MWAGAHAKVLVCNGRFIQIIKDSTTTPKSPYLVTEASGVKLTRAPLKKVDPNLKWAIAEVDYIDPDTGRESYVKAVIPHTWPSS